MANNAPLTGNEPKFFDDYHISETTEIFIRLRHERQTVSMELAAALHHSRDVGPAQHVGLQAHKTANSAGVRPGVLENAAPRSETEHEQHAALRGPMPPSPEAPSLATPLLARQAADGIDPSSLRFVAATALADRRKKEEEEEKKVKRAG